MAHPEVSRRSMLAAGATVIGGIGALGAVGGLFGAESADAAPAHGAPEPAGHRGRQRLTPEQQAGQRVIFSYPGLTPPQDLLDGIGAGTVGGVIFFGENIQNEQQIAAVVKQLRAAQASSPVRVPIMLMTDQEGGLIRRLPGAPVQSEKQIGASSDPTGEASQAGTGAGQNLGGVGMNVNLAPVLDVFRTPGDFDDQYQRSYSQDPNVCAECGVAFVQAQQALRIAATAKHFPGLGAATADENTDLGPVTLDVSRRDLHTIDEVPFRAAIRAGVDMIMASWAVYPSIDPNRPSGLSATMIQGQLRGRLGFRGVTITDALEAGALDAYGTSAQRGVLAAQAGMDVLLCSARDVSQGTSTVAALAATLQRGRAGGPWCGDGALQRVLELRSRLP